MIVASTVVTVILLIAVFVFVVIPLLSLALFALYAWAVLRLGRGVARDVSRHMEWK